jgi:hypothetical protein
MKSLYNHVVMGNHHTVAYQFMIGDLGCVSTS